MKDEVRLTVFIGGLVGALVAGFVLGRSVGSGGPAVAEPPAHGHAGATPSAGAHDHGAPGVADVGGLAISASGYTLVPGRSELTAAEPTAFTFTIVGPDGAPVTDYTAVHEAKLHLVVVRRDLTGFQHLHPELGAGGVWKIPLTLGSPGVYRMYADFTSKGVALTLGADLTVAGQYAPLPLPAAAREATSDGNTVTLEGTPRVGSTQPLMFRVFAAGAPVPNLDRYLGAYGHLIVVREGDGGYVHAHAETELAGGAIKFWFAAPNAGRYRAYLNYQVAGVVHTAEFTLVV